MILENITNVVEYHSNDGVLPAGLELSFAFEYHPYCSRAFTIKTNMPYDPDGDG